MVQAECRNVGCFAKSSMRIICLFRKRLVSLSVKGTIPSKLIIYLTQLSGVVKIKVDIRSQEADFTSLLLQTLLSLSLPLVISSAYSRNWDVLRKRFGRLRRPTREAGLCELAAVKRKMPPKRENILPERSVSRILCLSLPSHWRRLRLPSLRSEQKY